LLSLGLLRLLIPPLVIEKRKHITHEHQRRLLVGRVVVVGSAEPAVGCIHKARVVHESLELVCEEGDVHGRLLRRLLLDLLLLLLLLRPLLLLLVRLLLLMLVRLLLLSLLLDLLLLLLLLRPLLLLLVRLVLLSLLLDLLLLLRPLLLDLLQRRLRRLRRLLLRSLLSLMRGLLLRGLLLDLLLLEGRHGALVDVGVHTGTRVLGRIRVEGEEGVHRRSHRFLLLGLSGLPGLLR
jgi:hypothetical protein